MGRPRKGDDERIRPKVLGIRVSTDVLTSFKTEAAKRGLSVADLFEDIWERHQAERGSKE